MPKSLPEQPRRSTMRYAGYDYGSFAHFLKRLTQ